MANATAHRLGAAATVGLTSLIYELKQGETANLGRPLLATILAAMTATLPDVIEPATNPCHRQFFHSVIFAIAVGYGLLRLYKWEPREDWQKALRFGGLVMGGAYLTHLIMDAGTPFSLPLV
jgi:membrane-bound metal-dependent hydrolase YbcI (DUF457 family)